MTSRLKIQRFTLGLFLLVLFAAYFPSFGTTAGILRAEFTTKIAIALIVLLQCLTLNPKKLLSSVVCLRLHKFCQSWIFLLFPLLMIGIVFVCVPWIPGDIRH